MSSNVAYAGFSLKLNEEDQTENRLKEISKSLGYNWQDEDTLSWDNLNWNEIIYGCEQFKNSWKPHMDFDGTYGFIWVTNYEYEAYDIEYFQPISAMGKALKEFIDKTKIMPKEEITSFAQIYYNGADDPFKF